MVICRAAVPDKEREASAELADDFGMDEQMSPLAGRQNIEFTNRQLVSLILPMLAEQLLGITVGKAFGWSQMNCLFLAGMLAMSSTTIIYKAFDDMGLRQQQFAGLVMSVLILEDILAIVMMVMLSSVARCSEASCA